MRRRFRPVTDAEVDAWVADYALGYSSPSIARMAERDCGTVLYSLAARNVAIRKPGCKSAPGDPPHTTAVYQQQTHGKEM